MTSVFVFCVTASLAAHERGPGRSRQSEVFDRGPRQHAYLMGGTGNVHFPVSSKIPLVRKFVEQGVGQLHGFWFVEAERSFRQAAALDPECGIAYWGASVANEQLHPVRARQWAAEALKHKAGLTDREQMYVDSLFDESGYRKIIAKYPQDLEAKAFEAWRLWHKYEHISPPNPELNDALRLAADILEVEPMHPIHHAVIHICDFNGTHFQALDSAAKCGEAAPSIGHMWHMPTHIYFALKRYPEAAWQLEASIRTEHARMIHDCVLPDQVHLYAHNNEWLVRTLLYLGRVHEARRAAIQMIDLPRHPLLNLIEPPEGKDDAGQSENEDSLHAEEHLHEIHGTSAYYGRERLLQVLRQYEYWDDLIEACRSGYIEPTRLPTEQGKVHLNLGVAYYSRGDLSAGDEQVAKVHKLLAEQSTLRQTAIDDAERRPEPERRRALAAADARYLPTLSGLASILAELESYQRIDENFFISRKMLIVSVSLIFVAEMIVVWMLRRRRLQAMLTGVVAIGVAVWLFQAHLALWNLPYDSNNVDFSFMSRKQLEAGDPDVAEWCARQYAVNRPDQVRPQANLVETLYKIGKTDDARAEFEILRELAGTADLDCPPLARLAPIARELGYPTDWRRPEKINKLLADRQPLQSLGPLLWRPWKAPDWNLKDADGRTHTLAEFQGKPILMIFFLGRGCLHCKQQLEAFAKRSSDLSAAGLTVIAVSTDDEKGILKSLSDYGSRSNVLGSSTSTVQDRRREAKDSPMAGGKSGIEFPFLMLADPQLRAFQAYRAYDDFEQVALHGTILIDANAFVRWHDESFEPFMDVGFVIAESNRLLRRPVAPVEAGAWTIVETSKAN